MSAKGLIIKHRKFGDRIKMNIAKIEGIGPAYAAKLKEQGIGTTDGLLKVAANPKGRQVLSEKTGLSNHLILEWVNRADLMRVKGIGEEYSDLLEAAGVDTIRELAQRNPDNLHQTLLRTNTKKHLVRREPARSEVQRWVEQSKRLPAVISY
jgi:predicted flap endonuclease-1-like 5' DNA nuclease